MIQNLSLISTVKFNFQRSELDSDDDDDIDDPHHHPALAPSEQPVINNQDNLLGHIPPVADVLKKSSSQLIFFQVQKIDRICGAAFI